MNRWEGYHLEIIPSFIRKPPKRDRSLKGCGNEKFKGHHKKPNDLGITYPTGMGCHSHDNCFTCPYPPSCKFQNSDSTIGRLDVKFISNRGNGIDGWKVEY